MEVSELVKDKRYDCTNYRNGCVFEKHEMVYQGPVEVTAEVIARSKRFNDPDEDTLTIGEIRYLFNYDDESGDGVLFSSDGVEAHVDNEVEAK
jgi:hypothetical protein